MLLSSTNLSINQRKENKGMATAKKMIAVRFSESMQKEIEQIAEKLGMSQSAAVVFLTHLAVSELKKNKKDIVSETIFDSTIDKK